MEKIARKNGWTRVFFVFLCCLLPLVAGGEGDQNRKNSQKNKEKSKFQSWGGDNSHIHPQAPLKMSQGRPPDIVLDLSRYMRPKGVKTSFRDKIPLVSSLDYRLQSKIQTNLPHFFQPHFDGHHLYIGLPGKVLIYNLKGKNPPRPVGVFKDGRESENNPQAFYHPVISGNRLLYSQPRGRLLSPYVFQSIPIQGHLYHRQLVCYDKKTGKKLWVKDGSEDSFFRRASIIGPPLVYRRVVYGLAFRYQGFYQTYLVALQLGNGQLLWRKHIASEPFPFTLFQYPASEPAATIPAERDGILYVSTNLGTISALRAWDGKKLWSRKYESLPFEEKKRYYSRFRNSHSINRPLRVGEKFLYVQPVDSKYLYCLDRKKGKIIWKYDLYSQKEEHYFAGLVGVEKRNVLALENQHLVCLHRSSGKVQWKVGLVHPYQNQASANVITKKHLLHLQGKSLYLFDLQQGQLTGKLTFSKKYCPEGGVIQVRSRYFLIQDIDKVYLWHNRN